MDELSWTFEGGGGTSSMTSPICTQSVSKQGNKRPGGKKNGKQRKWLPLHIPSNCPVHSHIYLGR